MKRYIEHISTRIKEDKALHNKILLVSVTLAAGLLLIGIYAQMLYQQHSDILTILKDVSNKLLEAAALIAIEGIGVSILLRYLRKKVENSPEA